MTRSKVTLKTRMSKKSLRPHYNKSNSVEHRYKVLQGASFPSEQVLGRLGQGLCFQGLSLPLLFLNKVGHRGRCEVDQ